MISKLCSSVLCMVLSPMLVAQQAAPLAIQAASSTPAAGMERVHVPMDTLVTFRLEERISSADTPVGARVHLTLANDFSADGHVVAPAGTSYLVKVTRSRRKNARRNGELWFANPKLDLGHGQQIRFAPEDSGERKDDRELVALLLPAGAILAPIWAPWLAIHKIREICIGSTKPLPTNDLEYSAGYRFDYYVRSAVTVRLDRVNLPTPPSKSVGAPNAY
jgi:hypothetical protein